MVVCPNGSEPNPGLPDTIHLTTLLAATVLPPEAYWLIPFLPYIGPIDIVLADFCALEPVELPIVSADDFILILDPSKVALTYAASQRITAFVHKYLWYRLCHCKIDATPAAPAFPAAPVGLPAIDPPAIVPLPTTTPCLPVSDYSNNLTGTNAQATAGVYYGANDATTVRFTLSNTVQSGGGVSVLFDFNWTQLFPAFNILNTFTVLLTPGQTLTFVRPIFPGSHEIGAGWTAQGGAGVSTVRRVIEVFCGGDVPDGPAQDCCQPDPIISARLDQIWSMLQLMQRQEVPFAYVPGAIHVGLSGDGVLDVEGLIGALVDLTTVPPYLGHIAGSPDALFDVGWLTFGTADGFLRGERISSEHKVLLPDNMGAVTKIGYHLEPNVVATITELVREP